MWDEVIDLLRWKHSTHIAFRVSVFKAKCVLDPGWKRVPVFVFIGGRIRGPGMGFVFFWLLGLLRFHYVL